ncbi:helix-turn-helix domain-containing protein [Streptomyces sp. NPDC051921]|uniref:MmyB family transcriptional regulator n=1 Tax=Streptomyces sp. NPDC051921 TaxID=3155806 RepID=UPI003447AEAC
MGFPARRSGPGRRTAGLSQEQMDELLKRTQGTYNRFENGRIASPSTEFLTAVARVLQLSQHEWAFLWRSTRKELPPAPLHPLTDTAVVGGAWQHAIRRISGAAAYIHDVEWNVIAHNDDFRRLFPGERAPSNMMRWLLLDPAARTELMLQWEARWAPAVMPHLRHAAGLHPQVPGLAGLERDVLDDPVAGPVYRRCASGPVPHFDGEELPFRHAVHGPGRLINCLAEPVSSPGGRLMIAFYTPDAPQVSGGSTDKAKSPAP